MRKSSKAVEPAKTQSNKDIVKEKYPKAECKKTDSGRFYICVKENKQMKPVHSGFTKNESDAWKRAAHEVL